MDNSHYWDRISQLINLRADWNSFHLREQMSYQNRREREKCTFDQQNGVQLIDFLRHLNYGMDYNNVSVSETILIFLSGYLIEN